MNTLATRAKILELEAELQRISLALKIETGCRRSDVAWLLPLVSLTVGWFIRPRSRWLSALWLASRMFQGRRRLTGVSP